MADQNLNEDSGVENIEELERDLEYEKTRFVQASKRAANAVKQDLNVGNWLRHYPLESAIAIIGVGFCAGYLIQQKRKAM